MIDIDDLMGDPDFGGVMTVYRRQRITGSNGIATATPVPIDPAPWASIQSGANAELLRQSDYATAANVITVYTEFRLMESGSASGLDNLGPEGKATVDDYGNQILPPSATAFMADIVMYHGDPYEVFLVQDWSDYGQGFIEALCRKVTASEAALS